MSVGGRTFRAFRPSSFAQHEDLEESGNQTKQAKIELYSERAQAGLPLFEPANVAEALAGVRSLPIS